MNINCPICKRDTPSYHQEEHHLIPRSICRRDKYRKLDQIKEKQNTIIVCVSCGDSLHQLFTEKELAEELNTLEKILANEKVQNWIKWISKKPDDFSICMKSKKRK